MMSPIFHNFLVKVYNYLCYIYGLTEKISSKACKHIFSCWSDFFYLEIRNIYMHQVNKKQIKIMSSFIILHIFERYFVLLSKYVVGMDRILM